MLTSKADVTVTSNMVLGAAGKGYYSGQDVE